MNRQIITMLRKLGVSANLQGYEYLKTALELGLEDKSAINRMTKGLYPAIAKTHDTTPSRVERAIRHAIKTAFDKGDTDVLQDIFSYTISSSRGKPTNSEFIATVVEELRMEESKDAN